MAKPETQKLPLADKRRTVTQLRIARHVKDGKVVPEKWDVISETLVVGGVDKVETIESAVGLAVARSRWREVAEPAFEDDAQRLGT